MLGFKLAGNMAAVAAGKAAVIGLGLLTFAVLARHLGAEGLGEYRIVLTVLAFTGMAADFGLYAMALRKMAAERKIMGRVLGNALACRLTCTSVAVGLVASGAWAIDASASLRVGLVVAGVGWVAYQASEFMVSVFQERLRQDYAALTDVAAAAVTFTGVFILARSGFNLYGMLGATAIGFTFAFAARVVLARKLVAFRPRFELAAWWELMKSGLPVAASYTLILIYVRGDVLLLAHFHSATEVGLYDIAAKIYEISTSLPYLFGGLIMPLMTRDYGLNWDRYVGRLGGALAAVMAVVMVIFTLLLFYAEQIAVLLAGPAFKATADPLRILAIAIAMAAPAYALRFAAMAVGHQRQMLLIDIVGVACGLSAYWLLIPSWSYMGAAVGKCLVDMTILIGAASISSNLAAWRSALRSTLEVLMAGAVMAVLLWSLGKTGMPWYVNAGCGIVIYLLTLAPMPKLRQGLRQLAAE